MFASVAPCFLYFCDNLLDDTIMVARPELSKEGSFQGARKERLSILEASGSPIMCSLSGSHLSTSRFRRMAMLPRWQIVMERWAISAGAMVSLREMTQSMKFR